MKNVCIIIPYFGELPKNIITYLLSCKINNKINWLIFTNDSRIKDLNSICKNVTFIKSSLSQIKARLIKVTGNESIQLNAPYKLCDYRPLYGKMFSDYLKGYKYWGYSDLDIVYGNLWKYIKTGIKQNYNKIGKNGHFTLIKNTHAMNNKYKLPIYKNGHKIYLFKDIISKANNTLAFDEGGGINIICNQYNIKTYCNPHLLNDIIFTDLDLNTRDVNLYKYKWQCYSWHNGHDVFYYLHNGEIEKQEYGYFHFQKRHVFKKFINDLNTKSFFITTHGYSKVSRITSNSIKKAMHMNKSSFMKRLSYKLHWYLLTNQFAKVHIGKIRLPVKYILHSIFVNKDFRIFKI